MKLPDKLIEGTSSQSYFIIIINYGFVINFERGLVQDQFRQPLRLKQRPDSKSKRQNLSGHGQSPKHPSSQELSVSIRTSATACVYERRPHPCDGEIRMSSLPFLKDRTGFVTISTKSLQSRLPDNHLTQLHRLRAKTILNWIDR